MSRPGQDRAASDLPLVPLPAFVLPASNGGSRPSGGSTINEVRVSTFPALAPQLVIGSADVDLGAPIAPIGAQLIA